MTTSPTTSGPDDSGRAPVSPRRASIASRVLVAVVVAVVAAGLWVDAGGGVEDAALATTTTTPPLVGSATCAALGGPDTTAVEVATVAAPAEDPDGDDLGEAGAASLRLVDDEDAQALAAPAEDGGVRVTTVDEDGVEDGVVTLRWEGTPVLLSRLVETGETARVPGAIAGPCPTEPASRWIVPGVATAGGAAAFLHLANPTGASAALSITFTTPAGRVESTRLANVVVPAGGRETIALNDFAPEEPDLGVVVDARTGRVVVEAEQVLEAAVGGVDGRSVVTAHTEAAEVWTVPWVHAASDSSPWLWVTNADDAPTDVRIVVHGPDGPVVPPGAGLTVPAGTTQRLDLRGPLAEVGTAAVTVRASEGTQVVVAGAVLRTPAAVDDEQDLEDAVDEAIDDEATDDEATDDEATDDGTTDDGATDDGATDGEATDGDGRGGIAVVAATAAVDQPLLAASLHRDERDRRLVVSNPGEQDATVRVDVSRASAAVPTVVEDALIVPAGASRVVELGDAAPGSTAFVVTVTPSSRGVVAGLVSSATSGPLELTEVTLLPFPDDPVTVPVGVVRDRSLLHPIELAPAPTPTPEVVPAEPADEQSAPAVPAPDES